MDIDTLNICEEVVRRYEGRMEPIYGMSEGGEIRAARGELVELIVKDCCELVGLQHRKGTSDMQTITVGDFSKKHQVDGHIYKENTPVLFVEAKAYLDSCYYERACNDARIMKFTHPAVPVIVVALENSLADSAMAFSSAVFNGAVNQVFYLCSGKRSSMKPLYKRCHRKPIQVLALVQYLQSVCS